MSARPHSASGAVPAFPPLPDPLPPGERILWQGRPEAIALARHAYAAGVVALYFALVGFFRVAMAWREGGSLGAIFESVVWSLLPAVLALSLLVLLAFLQSRVTCYTLTNRRVAMQIGVALPVTINLPLAKIRAVDRRLLRRGCCDLVLTIDDDAPLGAALLWPHLRLGGRGVGNQPVLRCLAEPERISTLLAAALAGEDTDRETAKPLVAAPVPIRRAPIHGTDRAAAIAS